jgi:hypothetical protein
MAVLVQRFTCLMRLSLPGFEPAIQSCGCRIKPNAVRWRVDAVKPNASARPSLAGLASTTLTEN